MKKRKTIKLNIELDIIQTKRQRVLVSVGDDNTIRLRPIPEEAMVLTREDIIKNRADVLPGYRLIHYSAIV